MSKAKYTNPLVKQEKGLVKEKKSIGEIVELTITAIAFVGATYWILSSLLSDWFLGYFIKTF